MAEGVAFQAVEQLLSTGDLDDLVFARCASEVGESAIFELMTLIGYYQTLALQLGVFRI